MSAVLNNITDTLNNMVSAFQRVQDVAVKTFSTITEQSNAATTVTQHFKSELENGKEKNTPIEVTPVWDVQSKLDVFQNMGIDRLNLEMGSLNDITNEVLKRQQRIGEQALNIELLPKEASWDINATNQRIEELGQKLVDLQNIDISMMDDASVARMNTEYEAIRESMNSIINLQEGMNAAIEQGDISRLNESYDQLNVVTEQVERRVRESSAAIEEMNRIEWNTPDFAEVFTESGLKRFNQEIESAAGMVNRLTNSQQQISQLTAKTAIFPPNMVGDIDGVNSRIEKIRHTIQLIEANKLKGVQADKVNSEVEQLRQHLSEALNSQDALNSAMRNMDVSAANAAFDRFNSAVSSTERYIQNSVNQQGRFNSLVKDGEKAAENLGNKINNFVGKFLNISTIKQAAGWIQDTFSMKDEQIRVNFKLAAALDNAGADMSVFTAVENAAGQYAMYGKNAMMAGASELAKHVSDENAIVSMMNTLSNFAAGEGGANVDPGQMANYAAQLGDIMAGSTDALAGLELRLSDAQKQIFETGSDMEKAEVLEQIVSRYEGLYDVMENISQGKMQALSQTFQEMKLSVAEQLYPAILSLFDTIQANMPKIEQAVNGFVTVIQYVIIGIMGIISVAAVLFDFFADNWSFIEPVIWGIVAAFVAWKAITWALVAAKWVLVAVKWALVAANWALVAAILANPITWIAVAIGVVIGAIVAWINSVGGLKVAWLIVVNAILTAWDWVKIGFFTGVYWVIDLWEKMKLGMMTAGVAISNFMGDMKSNVLMILQNMVNSAIDIINKFISILNKIPGVSIETIEQVSFGTQAKLQTQAKRQVLEDALAQQRNQMEAGIAERAGKIDTMKDEARARTDRSLAEIEAARAEAQKKDTSKMFTAEDYMNGIGNVGYEIDDIGNRAGYTSLGDDETLSGIANDTANIAGNITVMKNTGEENLQYLRDIAEREQINRFTTAEVHVDFGGITNNVNSEMDLDGIVDYINDGMREAIEITAEGVYA